MDLVLAALLGVAIGIVTGLAPGIHVNLVCTLLLAWYPLLLMEPAAAAAFIISLSVAHTFLDAIPSVYLGAPDSANALGVLPGHRYLHRGLGLMAVKLSVFGALIGLIAGVAASAFFGSVARTFELVPKQWLGGGLLCIPLIMLARERKRFEGVAVVCCASVFGLVSFSYPNPLFPMLSGLFGISGLLYSLSDTNYVPEQRSMRTLTVRPWDAARAAAGGVIAGGLTAILPGVGAAHASVIGMLLAFGTGDQGFLIMTGAIGTVNFFLGLATYDATGSARNGALLAATALHPTISWSLGTGAALLGGGLAFIICLPIARVCGTVIPRIPYRTLSMSVIGIVCALVCLLNGMPGVLIAVTGTAIGLMSASAKTARAHAMSCILVPVGVRFLLG